MELNINKCYLIFSGLVINLISLIYASDSPLSDVRQFRFHPTKNSSCYQIYNSEEQVDALSCRKPHKEYRRTCVAGFNDNEGYCGLTTPSGEVVEVPCTTPTFAPLADSPNFDVSFNLDSETIQCYTVFKKGYNRQKLCPTRVADHAIGIVTPDKYLILIESEFCKPFKSKVEIFSDREFTSNFTFDPGERSCYQIYTPDQPISHYTCYEGNKIYKSCVNIWEENDKCYVVTTQNNETIILDCEGQTNTTRNCLKVYKDGNTTEACMEVLEEGCVGITTPSGLRMLFACRTCGSAIYFPAKYDKEKLKRQRKFVKTYLDNEISGKNDYYRNQFKIIIDKYTKKTVYPYWLPGSNCYGMTLDNNETVILRCTDREFSAPGCFEITDPDNDDKTDICASIHEENCVILETPKGKRIIFACYNEAVDMKQFFVRDELKKYKNGIYTFHNANHEIKKLYKSDKTKNVCKQHIEDYQTQWLHEHQCWGIVTPDLETILLDCPNSKDSNKTGCFQVYTQNYGSDNQILPSSYEVYDTCIEIINDICVGVVTREGWNLQLSCYFYPQGRCCGSKPTETTTE